MVKHQDYSGFKQSVKKTTSRSEAAPCGQMFTQSFGGPQHFLTHPPNLFCHISSGGNDIWPPDFDQDSPCEVVMAHRQKVCAHECGLAWKDVVLLSSKSAHNSCLLGQHSPSLTTYCECRVAISGPQMGRKSGSSAAVAATVALQWSEPTALWAQSS